MTKMLCLLLIIAIAGVGKASAVSIDQYNLVSPIGLRCIDYQSGKLLILGSDRKNSIEYPMLHLINNGSPELLPDYYFSDNEQKKLVVSSSSRAKFDNNGNVWLTGKSIYKYENNVWKEIFKDDEFNYARYYGQLIFDGNNNLWVTTRVKDNVNSISFGELLKYNGTNFEVVLKRSPDFIYDSYSTPVLSDRFSKLSDGSIAFHKTIIRQDNPELNTIDSIFDLIIFNPNNDDSGAYELKTFDWDSSYNKTVNNIYSDTDNKLWFAHNGSSILISIDPMIGVLLHTGLTRFDLETKEWYIFDQKDGMPFDNYGLRPREVNVIKRLNTNTMIMNISKDLYTINSNDKIEKLNWSDIIPKATIYKANSKVTDDFINQSMIEIQKEKAASAYFPQFHNIIVTEDGTVWILASKFLMKVPATVLGVSDLECQNDCFDIYPNPANDLINIQTDDKEFVEIEITNMLGISLISQSDISKGINISHLPTGIYYVNIKYTNGISKSKKFIKCD